MVPVLWINTLDSGHLTYSLHIAGKMDVAVVSQSLDPANG